MARLAGQRPRFERVSIEQGLSSSTVNCMLQDDQGFMWFGTEDGLNRYDGRAFTVYKRDPDDRHSLSKGMIDRIHEDRAGRLWVAGGFGGDSSIDRYDRETGRFTHYMLYDTSDPASADSDFIWTLYEDAEGALWVGTYRNGLHRYDPEEDRFIRHRHDPEDPHSLSSDRVYAIYEDREGTVWVGTKEGLNRFDRETGRFAHYRHDPDDPESLGSDIVQLIFEDREGRLWVTTFGVGIEQWDREGERVVTRYQHDPGDPGTIDALNRISDIYEDRSGSWWVMHFDRRLDRLDPQTGRFTRYRQDPDDPYGLSDGLVYFVTEDRSGRLWVGTSNGLDRYDRETDRFTHHRHDPNDPHSLSDDVIFISYEDRAGVLWFSSSGHGLNLYDPQRNKFAHYQTRPGASSGGESDIVHAIYEDSAGVLWIGSSAGLTRVDRGEGTWTQYRHDPDDPHSLGMGAVVSIYEDREGVLWIGTEGGLDRLDSATGQFAHDQQVDSPESLMLNIGTPFSILQDRSGVLWLAKHREGLCKFDRETGACTYYVAAPDDALSPLNRVSLVHEDREGILWVGSDGGLLEFDHETETFTTYERDPGDPTSLSSEEVLSIYQDRAGALWVGTNGGGLNRVDPTTETFIHYTERDGMPSNVVFGILEEPAAGGAGSYLWLSTSSGLSRFDPRTETFRNYDRGDGLQSDEFTAGAYHKGASGEMFFGGVNGVSAFYPADIRDNPYVPPIVLTALTRGGADLAGDRAVEIVQEIALRWPNNFFEFEFAALSYSQAEKNRHAYRLEGFEDGWNAIGTQRSGRYTNLPGGVYTLRLKGSNNDGVWNEAGAAIQVTVVPPFWGAWWFWSIVAGVLVAGAVGGYRLRVRSVEARSRELETQVEQRTAELRQEIEQRTEVEEALRASEMERAVAAERSRLARELHDAVTQTLFSASLIAEALPTLWEEDQAMGREHLAMLRQMSRGALAEMRALLLELRPAALVETSLEDLLRQLGEAVMGREGMPVAVEVEGSCELADDLHVALYRIAQEALNNVVKHAKASQVIVSLRCMPRVPSSSLPKGEGAEVKVELCICDDGRGFDPDDVPPERMGLGIMRERAEAVGAQLKIVSQPGQGTQLTVIWPHP